MIRSCTCSSLCASVTEIPGSVEGMYSSEPSSSGGMNSDPRRWYTGTVAATMTTAPATTNHFHRSDHAHTGS